MIYMTFSGVFWAFYTRKRKEAGPKHPLKKSYRSHFIGDKFGESLGGSQAPSGKSPDFPRSSPNFPGSFSATSPEVLSLWNLTAIQRFPRSFPNLPGSSPNFPQKFPDFPGGQPLSLGSLTPSSDSQKLSLILGGHRLDE